MHFLVFVINILLFSTFEENINESIISINFIFIKQNSTSETLYKEKLNLTANVKGIVKYDQRTTINRIRRFKMLADQNQFEKFVFPSKSVC